MAQRDTRDAGTLPDGWVWTTLKNVCEVNPRMTHPEGFTNETLVSFVPMAAVDEISGSIVTPENRAIGEVRRGYKRFAENDVIFAKITPCMENGKAAIARRLVNGIGLGSTEFHVLRSSEAVIPEWVYHFVRQESFRGNAAAEMTGTAGQLRVATKYMEEAPIPLAPFPEQHRIVAEIETQFTRLEAGVAALKRAQANLRRYKASVLKAACEGRLVPTEAAIARQEGRDYEPADVLLERILAERRAEWEAENPGKKYMEPRPPETSDLPELPEGWAWAIVEQLNPANRRCSYGVLRPGPHVERGTLLVRVGDIQDGTIQVSDMKRIAPEIAAKYSRTKLQGGEVVISLVGAIGRTAVVPESLAGANTARAVGVMPLTKAISAYWTEIWFRNPAKVSEMTQKSHEVARKTLNLEDVRSATVAIPPLTEQHRIVAEVERRLSVVGELEKQVEAALRRAERLRQAILKHAFEGKLVPQDPDDEPASALLARIRAGAGGEKQKGPQQIRLRGL